MNHWHPPLVSCNLILCLKWRRHKMKTHLLDISAQKFMLTISKARNQQIMKLSHLTNTSSPWSQPGWMFCHCTLQPWTQPSQAGWPCLSDGSWQPLASPWGEPLSWPCADASAGTAACDAGHGSASSSGGRSRAASAAHYKEIVINILNHVEHYQLCCKQCTQVIL